MVSAETQQTSPTTADERAKALEEVRRLCERFEFVRLSGLAKKYNEARTVNEFILPLFEALGWDVRNRATMDEVLPEEAASRGRVDWSFRLSSVPRFYLEAKKLGADLENPEFAHQAITYAYNKNVTWAVLTNFESLRLYNAEWWGPNPNYNLFLNLDVSDYESSFERLWLLSRTAVMEGALDSEASTVGKKLHKTPVGERLFGDLLTLRTILTDYFRAYNDSTSLAEIQFAVQRLLDRLIFIRTAEDRLVEPNYLRSLVRTLSASKKKGQLWEELLKIFRTFDANYDSQLFRIQTLDKLQTEVEPIAVTIDGLYGTRDLTLEYDFGAIDADVLGGVYEQYLGQLAKSPPVPKAKLSVKAAMERSTRQDTKPFRKAHGVYYTPKWVVRQILDATLGVFIAERTPDEVDQVRVLDPACGSGSFLVEAFRMLDSYWEKQDPTHSPKARDERRTRILTTNLYGIDLDPAAVEIAQLNLLLVGLSHRELLPDLTSNIVKGNSLVVSGSAAGKWLTDDVARTIAVDWSKLGHDGSFDVVIGNPPYIRAEAMDRRERDYFQESGDYHPVGRFDIYLLFMETALARLEERGRFGFIIPAAFASQNYGEWMRRQLLTVYRLESVSDLRHIDVFHGVAVPPIVVIASKNEPTDEIALRRPAGLVQAQTDSEWPTRYVERLTWLAMPRAMFRLSLLPSHDALIAAMESHGHVLGDVAYCITGFVAHDSKTGESKDRLLTRDSALPEAKPYLEAKEVKEPFALLTPQRSIRYVPSMMHRPKFPELFDSPKLLVHRVTGIGNLRATVDREGIYVNHSFDCIVLFKDLQSAPKYARGPDTGTALSEGVSLDALACVLNSSLMGGYFRVKFGTDMDATPAALRALPLPPLALLSAGTPLEKLGRAFPNLPEDERPAAFEELNDLVEAAYGVRPVSPD